VEPKVCVYARNLCHRLLVCTAHVVENTLLVVDELCRALPAFSVFVYDKGGAQRNDDFVTSPSST